MTVVEVPTGKDFNVDRSTTEISFATPEIVRLHENNMGQEYVIGPGDLVRIDFWNREKLSGEHMVGPYGHITLPMLGEFKIAGLSRKKASRIISDQYGKYYDKPIVTIEILKYLNNKVYVLGKISSPGVIHFSGGGTLLEAISMAGGLPSREKASFFSKCYIIRGKDQVIWVDLQQLLQKANIKLNIKLANNDIIYIPEYMDAAVFVMGEVRNPGSYEILTTGLSLMDAVNLAGGPTEDGNVNSIRLIRGMKEEEGVKLVDLDHMLARGDFSQNYLLKDNDIIYIPKKGIAKFNYYLRQIDPFLRTFISGTIVTKTLENE
jgi:polysaccharide export outer membrane protein